jgi:hypothetical protein
MLINIGNQYKVLLKKNASEAWKRKLGAMGQRITVFNTK